MKIAMPLTKLWLVLELPKDNDEEKLSRRNAIRNATLNATEKPFETAKISFELMEFLPELAQKGNANAVSDVGVAGLLASAACKGALFNVDINLSGLPEDMATEIRKKHLLSKKMPECYLEKLWMKFGIDYDYLT